MEEEKDDPNRRKKKVRMEEKEFTGDEFVRARFEGWMKEDGAQVAPKSYRESLMQNVSSKSCWWEWARCEEDDEAEGYGRGTDFAMVLNSHEGIEVDLSNPLCPRFRIDEKEKERLMRPFKRTLIVKVMGRQTNYGFMVKKLKQLWERKGDIEIFDLENAFFLVSFQSMEDYMEALTGGPWVVMDTYLNVARWKPDFDPKNEKIESMVAWVRFPELPAPLFDKKFLLNLGNAIGKAIRLDIHTAQRTRGKFARMCVELDLTKPLVPEFMVDGKLLCVEYESISLLCKKCGRYGHLKEQCEEFHRRQLEDRSNIRELEKEKFEKAQVEEGEKELWKIVQKNRRPRRMENNGQNQQKGSRFAVLEVEENVINEREVEEEKHQSALNEITNVPSQTKNENMNKMKQRKKQGKETTGVKNTIGKTKSENLISMVKNQEIRKEKEDKLKNNIKEGKENMNRSAFVEMDYYQEIVPQTNLQEFGGQEVEMVEKENVDPGDNEDDYEDVEDSVECTEMNIEEVGATPVLADD